MTNLLINKNKKVKSLRAFTVLAFSLTVFIFNFAFPKLGFNSAQAAISPSTLVSLHNQERESQGLTDLSYSSLLSKSAQAKAEAMVASDCWSHYCPNGKSPWDFFDDAGYAYVFAGENLAHGFSDNEAVMQAWMNSPTHRENVLKKEFTEVGIGIAYGKFQGVQNNIIIAVHFGSRFDVSDLGNANDQIDTSKPLIPPVKPRIQVPSEGYITNNNMIGITGSSEGSLVEIFTNNNKIGEVGVDGGVFTYRPSTPFKEGENSIYVKEEQSVGGTTSDIRNFVVDTQNPILINNIITAKGISVGKNQSITLEFKTNENLLQAELTVDDVVFFVKRTSGLSWEVDVQNDYLSEGNSINLKLKDLATNESSINLNINEISNLQNIRNEYSDYLKPVEVGGQTLALIGVAPVKAQINFVFVVFTIVVIAVDIYALKKTGLTSWEGKPHLHITNFVLIVFAIILGGLGGEVLTGLNR